MRVQTFLFGAALLSFADQAQPAVNTRGISPKVKLEETLSGHLGELNGRFKFRVTELTFAPGGHIGPHHHAGPGIRFVASGKVVFTEGGTATTYHAGEYFYESGAVVHTAHNDTKSPIRVVFIEILPREWNGPSVIEPKAY